MCPHCEQTRFDIPWGDGGDPIITCGCGTVLGTMNSLRACSNDETLTHLTTARLKKSP
jgi:hypothetical protein